MPLIKKKKKKGGEYYYIDLKTYNILYCKTFVGMLLNTILTI